MYIVLVRSDHDIVVFGREVIILCCQSSQALFLRTRTDQLRDNQHIDKCAMPPGELSPMVISSNSCSAGRKIVDIGLISIAMRFPWRDMAMSTLPQLRPVSLSPRSASRATLWGHGRGRHPSREGESRHVFRAVLDVEVKELLGRREHLRVEILAPAPAALGGPQP